MKKSYGVALFACIIHMVAIAQDNIRLLATLEVSLQILERALFISDPRIQELMKKLQEDPDFLHKTVRMGSLEDVKILISLGADINARSTLLHDTPLSVAARENKIDIARYLIEHGADVNAKDKYAMTPLHDAALASNYEIARYLLESGAQVNTLNTSNKSPLFLTITSNLGAAAVVELLLENDADVNIKASYVIGEDDIKGTVLHSAALNGYDEIAALLLRYGASVNSRDSIDKTPLHIAAQHGNESIVVRLLTKGANPNAQDNHGRSALHDAAFKGDLSIVKLLVDKGAQVDIKDHDGITPVDIAIIRKFSDIQEFLKQQID